MKLDGKKFPALTKVVADTGTKFPTLAKIVQANKVETHCYTTWHEGLRKVQEAQTIFNRAMNMAATETLPTEMKAQLSDFVASVYNLQANAEELFEELREVDAGAPPKPKEKEEEKPISESVIQAEAQEDYIKKSAYGNPIFDVEKGFAVEKLSEGSFGYVNHTHKLALTTWGSERAAKDNGDILRATDKTIADAKERYVKYFSKSAVQSSDTMSFEHYKNELVKLMSRYEEAAGLLMSDNTDSAKLEKEIWEAIDKKDLKKLRTLYGRMTALVDSAEMD